MLLNDERDLICWGDTGFVDIPTGLLNAFLWATTVDVFWMRMEILLAGA